MSPHHALRTFAACVIFTSAAALLAACGGASTPTVAADEAALRAAQPGELAAYFKSRIVQRHSSGPGYAVPTAGGGFLVTTAAGGENASTFSGTNLQEAGVDEDDLLKTDGSFIYSLQPSHWSGNQVVAPRLDSRRIHPDGSLGAVTGINLDQSWTTGMYLVGNQRIAVLGQKQEQLSLEIFNVNGDAQPVHASEVLIEGNLISTRRIGNVLYVASAWAPNLGRYQFPFGTPAAQIESAVTGLSASELLPKIRTNGGPAQPLVAEQDCLLQTDSASLSLQLTTVTAIDLSTPALQRSSRCFVGGGETLYMSPSAVYVASSRNYWIAADFGSSAFPGQASTDIHKFALQGLQIDYRGSAEVAGHLGWDREKMPYRMSEYQGDLRVLTFTGTVGWSGPALATTTPPGPASPARLTVLREASAGGSLQPVGTLPNQSRPAPIGHAGEQVYAVQFSGPLAYVVTFRRVDPLYVLDLSDPADPKTAGELAMPGYSDYLFPLGNGKLLGVGRDATPEGVTQGLKIALFDVANPAQPLLLSSRNLGQRGTQSALDYTRHGINIFQQGTRARIALPVRSFAWPPGSAAPQGLARYLVDTESGTLEERAIVPTNADPDFFFSTDRAIQTPGATYYFSGGQVSYTAEP